MGGSAYIESMAKKLTASRVMEKKLSGSAAVRVTGSANLKVRTYDSSGTINYANELKIVRSAGRELFKTKKDAIKLLSSTGMHDKNGKLKKCFAASSN